MAKKSSFFSFYFLEVFFFLSSVFKKKYIDMLPKTSRVRPSAVRILTSMFICRCVVTGIEANDTKPPMISRSPSRKLPSSLIFVILVGYNRVVCINVFVIKKIIGVFCLIAGFLYHNS